MLIINLKESKDTTTTIRMSLTKFVMFLTITFSVLPKISSLCDHTSFIGPLKIKNQETQKIEIQRNPVKVNIREYPSFIEAVIVSRFRYTAFCTTNFWDDMDCKINITESQVMKHEVEEWTESGFCKVGPYCGSQWQCYGAAASKCLEEFPTMNERGRSEFLFAEPPLPTKLSQQCTQDWKCSFKSTKMPVRVLDNGSRDNLYTADENGQFIVLNGRILTQGFARKGLYKIIFKESSLAPAITEGTANCYSGSPENTVCIIQDQANNGLNNIPIKINPKTGHGTNRNYLISIQGKIDTVINGKLGSMNFNKGESAERLDDYADASIGDLIEIINALKAVQLQSLYNSILLQQELSHLQEIFIKTINSVGKIDDHLIGEIIGIKGRTKWFNEMVFNIHICANKTNPIGPNCQRGERFDQGRWRTSPAQKGSGGNLCNNLDPTDVQEIGLFNSSEIDATQINLMSPEKASNEWEGWSWLSDNARRTEEVSTKMESMRNDLLKMLSDQISGPFALVTKWLVWISSFVGWIALFLVVCTKR